MINFVFLRGVFRPTAAKATNKSSRFVRIADSVSSGMGTPTNIAIWAVITIAWFMLFAFNPGMQNSSFIPSWFTSNAFNFPLNTITTLAELFIGFLIAAAANRVEKRNRELHETMATMLRHIERMAAHEGKELDEIIEAMHLPHPPENGG